VRNHHPLAALGAALMGVTLGGQAPPTIPADQASRAAGTTATVCGVVRGFHCDLKAQRTTILVGVAGRTPSFAIAIEAGDRARFDPWLRERYDLRRVCVTGKVERVGGGYEVRATGPAQLQEPDGPPDRPDAGEHVYVCDPGVTLPKLKHEARFHVRRPDIQGRIVVQGVVGPDGKVREARVLRSLDPGGLDAEAVSALGRYLFEPGQKDGQPVPVLIEVEYTIWVGEEADVH
jgi:TonB family protein